MEVKTFNEELAREELKKCPKIVRDYVKLLEKDNARWVDVALKAIRKLRAI